LLLLHTCKPLPLPRLPCSSSHHCVRSSTSNVPTEYSAVTWTHFVWFEVSRVLLMMFMVFRDTILCWLPICYQHHGSTCCLHLHE
jgi:hypothetical protein